MMRRETLNVLVLSQVQTNSQGFACKKCDSNCICKKYQCKKLYEHSPRKKHRLIFVPTISKDKMIQERMNELYV